MTDADSQPSPDPATEPTSPATSAVAPTATPHHDPITAPAVTSSGRPALPDPLRGDPWLLGIVLLVAFAAAVCFFGLSGGPPMGDHECIHAQCARQVRQSGEWLVPYFNDIPRVNKPPLGTWLIALSSLLIDPADLDPPVSTLAARLPQALAGFANVLVLCWLGSMMFGRRAGLVAGFIAAASLTTIYYSHSALIEMTLVLFTCLAYGCFWRATSGERIDGRWMAAFYIAFVLAMMAKMPLPLVLVGVPLAIYWLLARPALQLPAQPDPGPVSPVARYLVGVGSQIKALPRLWFLPGVILFVILAGAWPLYVCLKFDGAPALWKIEFLGRYSGGMSERVRPWWYYIPLIFGLAAPFLLSLPEAVASSFLPRYRRHRRALVYLLIWGLVGVTFLSTSSFKRPHYLAAVMPPFLLMLAPVIDRLFFGGHQGPRRAVSAACYLLLAVIAVGLVVGGVYVGLRMQALLRLYLALAAGLLVLWGGASVAFRFERYTASFALLCLGSLVMVAGGWKASGMVLRTDARAYALADAFSDLDLGPDDRIIWVDDRVDATTAFYGRLRIERLFTPLEMVRLRQGRKRLPPELVAEAVARMDELLRGDRTTYFILNARRYEQFRRGYDLPAREVFRLSGYHPSAAKDLVILGPTEDAGDAVPRPPSEPPATTTPATAPAPDVVAPASFALFE